MLKLNYFYIDTGRIIYIFEFLKGESLNQAGKPSNTNVYVYTV